MQVHGDEGSFCDFQLHIAFAARFIGTRLFLQHAIQMATIQRQDTAKGMFYTLQPRAEPIDRNMPTPK